MKNRLISKTIQLAAIVLAMQLALAITPARAQLDETCTVTVNGQNVNVGLGRGVSPQQRSGDGQFGAAVCHLHERRQDALWPLGLLSTSPESRLQDQRVGPGVSRYAVSHHERYPRGCR